MIPLLEFKKLLGEYGENLTDQKIVEIRAEQYKFAEIAIKAWIKEKGFNKLKRSSEISYNEFTNERR